MSAEIKSIKQEDNNIKKRLTIGLIINVLTNQYEETMWKQIATRAESQNMNFLTLAYFSTLAFFDRSSFFQQHHKNIEIIRSGILDGIIIISSAISSWTTVNRMENILKELSDVPCVSIGIEYPPLPSILIDNETGMKEVLYHLIHDHGYRKIGFISGSASNPEAGTRYNTYLKVLKENNLPFRQERVFQSEFYTIASQYYIEQADSILRFINNNRDLEAVVCANDSLAINFIKKLNKAGIKVPEDMAVTGFDDLDESSCLFPNLTTVHQPLAKMGDKAFDIMLGLLQDRQAGEKIVLPSHAIIRRSCGCFPYGIIKIDSTRMINYKKKFFNKEWEDYIYKILVKDLSPSIDSEKLHKWAGNLGENIFKTMETADLTLFLKSLEQKIIEGIDFEIDILSWTEIICNIISRMDSLKAFSGREKVIAELKQKCLFMIGEMARQHERYNTLILSQEYEGHYLITQNLISAINREELKSVIFDIFPKIGFLSFYIVLYTGENIKKLKIMAAFNAKTGALESLEGMEFPSIDLLLKTIDLFQERKSYFISSLLYENELLGYIILEIGPSKGGLYINYTAQLSSAIRSILLMEDIRNHSMMLEKTVEDRTKELVKANQQLKELDNLKNDFIANITHDFRSPLTIIMNLADLSLHFPSKDDMNRNLELIYDSSLKLKNSIDRLLDLAKMDAHGIKLKVESIDIVAFLKGIIKYYSSVLMQSGIKIINRIPEMFAIDNFYTDMEKLEEVINNVLSNAIKFVDFGKGIIEIFIEERKDYVEIIIKDNGIGIPKDKLDIIFNRFEQAHQGRNMRFGGTGIGLAFSRQLIEYMRGKIWAESEGVGRGTSIFISLPLGKKAFKTAELVSEEKTSLLKSGIGKIINIDLKKKMQKDEIFVNFKELNGEDEFDYKKAIILIIDDDMNICKIVMKYLEGGGYRNLIITNSGKKGLEATYNYSPKLIICDYNIPDINGSELHDKIISNPRFNKMPFIFLSAIADRNLIIERKEKGASAYLKKPIDAKDFILTVDLHLKNYFEYLKNLQLATIDELTGVNNRRAVVKRLNEELALRTYRDLSLIFFDLDLFKDINDAYGHYAGDKFLKTIGYLLKTHLRDYDISGRYGGDEFLIILPDTNEKQAVVVAESIRSKIKEASIKIEEKEISIGLSMGIVSLKNSAEYIRNELGLATEIKNIFNVSDTHNTDWENIKEQKKRIGELLVKMVDTALYRAKKTRCLSCDHESEKVIEFNNNRCPRCGSDSLKQGRDQIVVF